MENWIQTNSGRAVDPLNPDPKTLVIEDIAHALSLVNRYTGHTFEAYSVGVHSLAVSKLIAMRGYSLQTQLWALLHDATEAYLSDIAAPVKQSPIFAGYRAAEKALEEVLRARFMPGAVGVKVSEVKVADWDMLLAERNEVMPEGQWAPTTPPADASLAFTWAWTNFGAHGPVAVRSGFLGAFVGLGGVR